MLGMRPSPVLLKRVPGETPYELLFEQVDDLYVYGNQGDIETRTCAGKSRYALLQRHTRGLNTFFTKTCHQMQHLGRNH